VEHRRLLVEAIQKKSIPAIEDPIESFSDDSNENIIKPKIDLFKPEEEPEEHEEHEDTSKALTIYDEDDIFSTRNIIPLRRYEEPEEPEEHERSDTPTQIVSESSPTAPTAATAANAANTTTTTTADTTLVPRGEKKLNRTYEMTYEPITKKYIKGSFYNPKDLFDSPDDKE